MAKAEILRPFILSWEGGYANDPLDRGHETNKGVTIATWRKQGYDNDGDGDKDVADLKKMTDAQWTAIFKKNFWDRWHADEIEDQSIANTLVDWVWGSGKYGITIPQQMLGVKPDGVVGVKTIQALNSYEPEGLFSLLQARRKLYLQNIVKNNASQKKFLNGWLRRVNSIKYGSLALNGGKTITF